MTDEVTNEEAAQPTDIDWKSKSREWETRSKENYSEVQRLTKELEDANKKLTSWSQREEGWDKAKADYESNLANANKDSLRYKVALKHGLGEQDLDFLTGDDEEKLDALAARLAAKPATGIQPDPTQGAQKKPAVSKEQAFRDALFGDKA